MKSLGKILVMAGLFYLAISVWNKIQAGASFLDALVSTITELPARVFKALKNILTMANPLNWYALLYAFGRAVASIFVDGRSITGALFDFKTDVLDTVNGAQSNNGGPDYSAHLP